MSLMISFKPINKFVNVYVLDFGEIVFVQFVEMVVITDNVGRSDSNGAIDKLVIIRVLFYEIEFVISLNQMDIFEIQQQPNDLRSNFRRNEMFQNLLIFIDYFASYKQIGVMDKF